MLTSLINKIFLGIFSTFVLLNFNTDIASTIHTKLNKTQSLITQYENNEKLLIEKYETLEKEANELLKEKNKVINNMK